MGTIRCEVDMKDGETRLVYFAGKGGKRNQKELDAAIHACEGMFPRAKRVEAKWMPDYLWNSVDGDTYTVRGVDALLQDDLRQMVEKGGYGGEWKDGVYTVSYSDVERLIGDIRRTGRIAEYGTD